MTVVEQMAEFAVRADMTSMSRSALLQLKIRILDSLGCAIGALGGDPVRRVRQFVADFRTMVPVRSLAVAGARQIERRC